jgi:hypothetical protein
VSPESLASRASRAPGERRRRVGRAWSASSAKAARGAPSTRDARVVAEAPTLVVANAVDAKRLLPEARLSPDAGARAGTYLPPGRGAQLDIDRERLRATSPRCRRAAHCIGASYHTTTRRARARADHRGNLGAAESMLPGSPTASSRGRSRLDRVPRHGARPAADLRADGRGRRARRDRLGLARIALGAAGRGAARLPARGEPLPLPRDLAGAISPQALPLADARPTCPRSRSSSALRS